MNNPFDGMAALVTGGSSGIDLATRARLRHEGVQAASLDLKPGPADENGVLALAAEISETASMHAAA
jgi:NAD(P)-dependent dehydrogenase (short-subunit alcohol dehydrogenase family)